MSRKDIWKKIWDRKYDPSLNDKVLPHEQAGFDLLTEKEWDNLTDEIISILGLRANYDVCEIGCGVGAFLQKLAGVRSMAGIDYSTKAIETIKRRLSGNFYCCEAINLPFLNNHFDVVFSWSVFFYFDSLDYAVKALDEMLRITKSSGRVVIGDINDEKKRKKYDSIRENKSRDERKLAKSVKTTHMFYSKEFFLDFAKKNHLDVSIMDESDMNLNFYENSSYRFTVIYTKP